MKYWFISDLHIKNENERNGNTLLRFFFYLNQDPTAHTLYLLGDIFDLWISDGRVFLRQYQQIVDQIKKFKDRGGQLIYFEGNHDFHIDRFWTKKLSIPVIKNESFFHIDGLKVRCEHGDYINPEDMAYLSYREFVRRPLLTKLAHTMPSHFWKWLGESLSAKSRKKTSRYHQENVDKIRTMIQVYAMKVYNAEPFDIIITGHMHVFDDYIFKGKNGKSIRSINLGTWLEKPRAVKIENADVQIIDLDQFL